MTYDYRSNYRKSAAAVDFLITAWPDIAFRPMAGTDEDGRYDRPVRAARKSARASG